MSSWLFENPLPVAILCGVVTLLLLWRGRGSPSRGVTIAAASAAFLGVSALLLGRFVVTPGEEARAVVEALVACAEEAETVRAAELFTPNAVLNYGRRDNPGLSIDAIRGALSSLARSNRIETNRITRLVLRTLDERTGEVELSCSTSTASSLTVVPSSWIIRVRQTNGAWKIDRLTFESVFGQPPIPRVRW